MPSTRPRRRWPWAALAAAFAAAANRLARRAQADQIARGEAVRELATSEARYRSLSLAAAPMVWTVDSGGRVEDVPEWREYTGQDAEDVRGAGWLEAVHPDDRAACAAAWSDAVAAKGVFASSFRLRRADGTWREMAARGVPVVGEYGVIGEWVGTCTDVTAQRAAEQARDEADARADALAGERDEAVARADAAAAARDEAVVRLAALEGGEAARNDQLEADLAAANDRAAALEADLAAANDRAAALEADLAAANDRAAALEADLAAVRLARDDDTAAAVAERDAAFQAHRRLAEPPGLPQVPGVGLSVGRVLADAPTGAWSDAFMASERHLALAVGNGPGAGADAVGRGAQLAAALRAYALDGHGPGDAVARLNAVAATLAPDAPASLLYATLDLHTGTLRYVIAGDPAGVLLLPDGTTQRLDAEAAPPVGAAAGALVHEGRLALPRGASLLLAAGVPWVPPGPDALHDPVADALADAPRDPRETLDHVAGALFPDGTPETDAALLLLQAASPEDLVVPDGSAGPVTAARQADRNGAGEPPAVAGGGEATAVEAT